MLGQYDRADVLFQVDRAYRKPLLIVLPLRCRLSLWRWAPDAVLMPALAAFGGLALLTALVLPSDGPSFLVVIGGGLFALRFGVLSVATWKQLKPRAALLLERHGFSDERLGVRMAWEEISQAHVEPYVVRITPKAAPSGPSLQIPLRYLGPEPGVAAEVFAVLVERAGGHVVQKR